MSTCRSFFSLALLAVLATSIYIASGTVHSRDPQSVLPGRWIPTDQLGVIRIVSRPSEFTLFSYLSTDTNRWAEANGTFDVSAARLTVHSLVEYPFRRHSDSNATGGGVLHSVCFSAILTAVNEYPLLRWEGACGSTPRGGSTAARAQSMGIGVEWHLYGTDVLCLADQPMGTTYVQDPYLAPQSRSPAQKKRRTRLENTKSHVNGETESSNSIDPNSAIDIKTVKRVHVIFTQHFDLGYTDFAWCVLDHYFLYILPTAALTAEQLPEYVYTTHPFLLYMLFNCEALLPAIRPPVGVTVRCPSKTVVTLIDAAIRRQQIVWHAFPFDGFNEILGLPLYNFSFNYARWLTKHFFPNGEATAPTAMHQVDVPGLFGVQVTPILDNGVRGIYIGQNPQPIWSGALSNAPRLFLWQPPSVRAQEHGNRTLLVMSHRYGYGGIRANDAIVDPRSGAALLVMCTVENRPSETVQTVESLLGQIRRMYPFATTVKPSTYDAFIDDVASVEWPRTDLPLIREDIGDSWIRSSAGDPVKNSEFLRMRRRFEKCLEDSRCTNDNATVLNAALFLLSSPEHNAGLPFSNVDWETTALSYVEKRQLVKTAARIMPELGDGPIGRQEKSHSIFPRATTGKQSQFLPLRSHVRCEKNGATFEVSFDDEGAISYLARILSATGNRSEAQKLVIASGGNSSRLFTLLYVMQVTNSPTWGDPSELVYEARMQNVSVTHDSSDDCAFHVRGLINQTYFDPASGAWRAARNRDPESGAQLSSNMQATVDISLAPEAGGDGFALNASLAIRNIELSNANGVYESYTSGVVALGDAFFVQVHPTLTAGEGQVPPPSPRPNDWRVTTLAQRYSPADFRVNGTCNFHIADELRFQPSQKSRSSTVSHVDVVSHDAPLAFFGWESARWQSQQDPQRPGMCLPDVSSGVWFGLWNQYNANWCVVFPWDRNDGLDNPLNFGFSIIVS